MIIGRPWASSEVGGLRDPLPKSLESSDAPRGDDDRGIDLIAPFQRGGAAGHAGSRLTSRVNARKSDAHDRSADVVKLSAESDQPNLAPVEHHAEGSVHW